MARILVADDDDDIRTLLQILLESDGHVVEAAADGLEGLAKHRAMRFDLVCLDLDMPRLNGIELTHAIRSGARADLPILMITGSASTPDHDAARAAGVSDLLGKPFGAAALRERVAALLSSSGTPG